MSQPACRQLASLLRSPAHRTFLQDSFTSSRQASRSNLNTLARRSVPSSRTSSAVRQKHYSTQPEAAVNEAGNAATAEPESAAASGKQDQAGPSKEQEAHAKALAQKDAEIQRLKDSLLLEMANFQNLQKNSIREKANARDYAITKFAEEIVANIDVLKIALDSIPEAKRSPPDATGDAADLKSLWQGVKMMMGELEKTLSRQGIKPFDPMGEKFDPNRHEALFQTAVAGKEPGTVFMTQRKGWMIRDRLLRPAEVGVVRQSDA